MLSHSSVHTPRCSQWPSIMLRAQKADHSTETPKMKSKTSRNQIQQLSTEVYQEASRSYLEIGRSHIFRGYSKTSTQR